MTSTRSIRATAFFQKIRPSPAPAQRRASICRARRPKFWNCWATRPPPAHWRIRRRSGSARHAKSQSRSPEEAHKIAQEIGYPADRQGGHGRRRPRHARGPRARADLRRDWKRRRAKPGPRSAMLPSSWKNSSRAPGTSKCRFWATSMATWCISTNAIAPCSAATRKSSRSPRLESRSDEVRAELCEAAVRIARKGELSTTPAPWNFSYDVDSDEVVFHRSQSAHSGRAHRDRNGHRHRHGPRADPRRAGAHAARSAAVASRSRIKCRCMAPPCNAASPPKIRPTSSRPTTAASPPIARPAGFGIRLDGGTAYSGASSRPITIRCWSRSLLGARDLDEACQRMDRALREFRIRGVKTNIPFLENVVNHPQFRAGEVTTSFLDDTPELFRFHGRARSRHQTALLPRRRHRQRQSAR